MDNVISEMLTHLLLARELSFVTFIILVLVYDDNREDISFATPEKSVLCLCY